MHFPKPLSVRDARSRSRSSVVVRFLKESENAFVSFDCNWIFYVPTRQKFTSIHTLPSSSYHLQNQFSRVNPGKTPFKKKLQSTERF